MGDPVVRSGMSWLAWALLMLALACSSSVQAAQQDITAQFAITRSGLVLNRFTNTFDATVALKNASAAAVPAPIVVVVNGLPPNVALANKAGLTTDGKPYVSPAVPGGTLPPGAALSLVLKFANPQRVAFPYTLLVQSGIDLPLDAPALMAVVATGGTNAVLIGRVVGASNLPITLQPTTSASCIAGSLAGSSPAGNPIPVTTDADGYFAASVSGIDPGAFVAINVVTPTTTATSLCLVSSRDNDSWPKAFALEGSTASVQDLIDAPGKARWYKFDVLPGQTIDVRMSGLRADYDLAVFKDIGQTFAKQFTPGSASTSDLVKLTAEYAPSVFSPSVFSPSVFSPSVFSPSVFSPSVFSPSVFSPSVFSPSVFSPSVFSPSVFSPSVFSPSVFSPSVFSPSVFSSQELAQAFSTAQTRSVISVAATPGTSDETTTVNTWNNTGSFYGRVVGHNGAFDTTTPFALTVVKGETTCAGVTDTAIGTRAPVMASALQTVILADSSRTALDASLNLPGGGTLRDRLATFAKRTDIAGVVVDVAADARVQALKSQAANHPACVFAKNLVAQEIKGIVDAYRTNPLRYIVVVGNDDAIPFFRTPDQSGLGEESTYVPPVESNSPSEASLRRDYVLSQDGYGSTTSLSLRTYDFPVPGLAVGRLVETPLEIAGLLDAYSNTNGVVSPKSSLVTGYDFLADDASAVRDELQQGTGATPATLITPNGVSPQDSSSWTADQLRGALFGARHDLIFLAGHFSANSALAADFTTSVLTTELAGSTTDFTNSIVFSAGCHSGYNIVDADAIAGVTQPLDWAQAFARKGATLIAGTGYQYGDTDFLEYSERIYDNFARQLRGGTGGVALGEALVKAKRDYLDVTPDVRGLHEKALLEATLFGLPMLRVDMPSGRGATSGTPPVISASAVTTGPALSLGMKSFDLTVSPTLTSNAQSLTNTQTGASITATWQSGPDGVVTRPGEPALPLVAVNVTPTDAKTVLRGIGFRGGSYTDVAPMFPFSGAPTTELRGVHVPFVSPTFYPARLFTANYFGALSGAGGTTLLVTPVQHRVASIADGTSVERTFGKLNLRLFYSGNLSQAALSDAPSIIAVDAKPDATGIAFTAQVVGNPAAGMQQVWVTWTSDGSGAWTPLDLTQCVAPLAADCAGIEDSRLWKGHLASAPVNLVYVVQAVSAVGLVALDDNRGAYYGVVTGPPAVTTFALDPLPSTAAFGETLSISGTLTSGGAPVAGKFVTINVGGTTQIGITDSAGRVTVQVPALAVTGSLQISASFSGDSATAQSSMSAPLTVAPAPSNLVAQSLGGALTGVLGGASVPLAQQSVAFAVDGPGGPRTIFAITDYLGQATLPPPGLPAGQYTVTQMSFAGNATYAATSVALAQQFTVAKTAQAIAFAALADRTEGEADFAVYANASSGLPVSFAAVGACTLAGNNVHITSTGSCTITASQAGDVNFDAASPVARTFAIAQNGKADQVIAFGAAPSNVHVGDAPLTITATSSSPAAPPSGIPILFSSLTSSICTSSGTSGATITPVAAGTCTIAANEAGDANYNPAPQTTLSFTIAAAGAGQFGATSAMLAARSDHTATLLEDGRVLIAGGFGAGGAVLGNAELYCPDNAAAPPDFTVCPSPQRGAFVATNPLAIPAAGQTATRLHDGRVLLIGGANANLQWFTPATQTWSATAALPLADRSFHTATLLANGNVFVAGGVDSTGATLATTFIVGTSANPFTIAQGPDLAFDRESHTATLLPDGTVLIAGGRRKLSVDFTVVGEYELFDPSVAGPHGNGAVSDEGAMSRARFWHAAEIAGLNVVVTGGSCDPATAVANALSSTELFSFSTGPQATVACNAAAGANDLVQARRAFTMTPLHDGTLVVIGGADGAGTSRNTSELFSVAGNTFALGPSLATARAEHQATLLLDGRVLVTGGVATGGAPLASAEILNGAGGSGTANQRPVANAGTNQSVTVGANVQLTSAGSSDPEGRALTYYWALTAKPTGSTAQLSDASAPSPTFVADKTGVYAAQLIVNDGGLPPLDSAAAGVEINAGSANQAPLAVADSYAVSQDATLVVDVAQGVLANDSDADGNGLTAVLDATAAHGALTLNADGSFTYTAAAGYSGADSFTYHANDGTTNSNVATVSLTVNAVVVNQAPVANAGSNQSTTTGQLVQLAGTCSDADNDPTTAAWSFTSKPATSAAALSSTSSLAPTFTPDVDGSYVLQLVCNDGKVDSTLASVTITASTGTISVSPASVQPGGSAAVSITVNPAAPSGGLVVAVSTSDTNIATFATPTVTIPAGQTSGTATVNGIAIGSTNITAQASGYVSGQGSVTVSGTPFAFTVTNLADAGAGSLRDAIAQANAAPGPNAIAFAPGLTGTITLTSGQIRISDALVIAGPGAGNLTIDGNANDRIFTINEAIPPACPATSAPTDYSVTISGLTLANAHRNVDSAGGAINASHTLALDSVVIRDSFARSGGGLHFNFQYAGQSLTIVDSQFSNNLAKPLSTISTATSDTGGAVNIAELCGGARTTPATVTIASSVFNGNRVQPVALEAFGGAIQSSSYADIAIVDTRIVDNHIDVPNPPIVAHNYRGGGAYIHAKSLQVLRSEISDNSVIDATSSDQTRGGGLGLINNAPDLQTSVLATPMQIVNSTISGNSLNGTAGAMWVFGNVALEIDNSTINNNAAAPNRTGGMLITTGATNPAGASNALAPSVKLVSSIIANSAATTADIATSTTPIPSFTLDSTNSLIEALCSTCNITINGTGNLTSRDPALGALTFNGGATRTHAVLAGSPAIDAGSNPLGLATDQRGAGFARVVGAAADMGAYEGNNANATFTVTNLNDNGPGSLRDAVSQSRLSLGSNTIDFAPGLTGTIVLTSGQIQLAGPLTIVGPGASALTIDGNASSRIFGIFATEPACPALDGPDYQVTISGLRLTNARRLADSSAGAVFSEHSLVLDSVVIDNSIAKNGGGVGFFVQYPGQSLTITNSQFLGNIAKPLTSITGSVNAGGAIAIAERCAGRTTPVPITIANSVFSGNRNQPVGLFGFGGAISSLSNADITITDTRIVDNHIDVPNPPPAGQVYQGGAIYANAMKSLQLVRTEITENSIIDASGTAPTQGGALFLFNAASDLQTPQTAMSVRAIDSTISTNSASALAGAIYAYGNIALELDNSTVSGNTAVTGQAGGILVTTGPTQPAGANNATAPTLRLVSSIVANSSPSDVDATIGASFTIDATNSLIEALCPTCNIAVTGSGNIINSDPLLAPLAFNGGTSRTEALLAGSPAIDAGSNPLNLAIDQRGAGFPRVAGAAADMGAYESTLSSNHAPVANAGSDQVTNVGQLVQLNGTCTDADNDASTPTWSITSKPATSTTTLSSVVILTPTLTPDVQGTYSVQLVCNDGKLDSAPSSVTITVSAPVAQGPTVGSIAPASIRRGAQQMFMLTGTNLAGAGIATGSAEVSVSSVTATSTQVQFTLTATSSATLGSLSLTVTAPGGSVNTSVDVWPVLPQLTTLPAPVAIPPDNLGHSISLRLTSADVIDHVIALATSDASLLAVSPAQVTIPAGTTEIPIQVTGKAAGTADIATTSATLGNSALPVFITANFTGLNTTFAPAVGVVLQGSGSTSNSFPGTVAAAAVGVTLGTAWIDTQPNRFVIGSSGTITVVGSGWPANVTAAIAPADGVTLGTPTVAADGSQVTVAIAVDSAALLEAHRLTLTANGQPVLPARVDADQILVTLAAPVIRGIDPIYGAPGETISAFRVVGDNLNAASAIGFSGGDVHAGANPTVNADGTEVTTGIVIDSAAPAGPRTVTVQTPGGTSTANPSLANTFNVVNQIQQTYTPILSPAVGVVLGASAPPGSSTYASVSPVVGVTFGSAIASVAPRTGAQGASIDLVLSGQGLTGVTSVTLTPANDLSVGVPVVTATSVTVPVTIAAGAALSARRIDVFAGTALIPFADPALTQFTITAPQPQLESVSPIVVVVGTPAVTFTLNGSNFQGATAVRMYPSTGVTFAAPVISSDGTSLTVAATIAADAPTGDRLVTVVTAAGETSQTASIRNTVTISATAGTTYNPLVSNLVGVVVGSGSTGSSFPATIVSPIVGVNIPTTTPPTSNTYGIVSPSVGAIFGSAAVSVSPPAFIVGQSGTLTVNGVGLPASLALSVSPATDITLSGAPTVNAAGTQATIPITIGASASLGPRQVLLASGTAPVAFADANASMFVIAAGTPTIDSLTPILAHQGDSVQFTIRGSNLQYVTAVTAEPGSGYMFGVPVASADGTQIVVGLAIAPNAPAGASVVRVTTLIGTSTSAGSPANTFTVFAP